MEPWVVDAVEYALVRRSALVFSLKGTMAAVEALCAEVRADVKAAVEASGTKWKDSKWSGFTVEVVSFLLGKNEDVGDVVAAAAGLILYGATTKEKLQAVAG